MFKNVIVRKPSKSMTEGIKSQKDLGIPEYEKAMEQHRNYVKAMEACNVKVTSLEADERFPDSCFVEDAAILTKKVGIITRPGAESRRGEEEKIHEALKDFYDEKDLVRIKAPGTIEGGDVMMVGDTFYIGLSARTNEEGANQAIEALERYGYKGIKVPLKEYLHLKTGLSYLEENRILITGEFLENPQFDKFEQLSVSEEEEYAANSIWVNGTVIVPKGFPETLKKIQNAGYPVIIVDVSEYQKLDGGLSCLSLRF